MSGRESQRGLTSAEAATRLSRDPIVFDEIVPHAILLQKRLLEGLVRDRDTLVRFQHVLDPGWFPRDITGFLHIYPPGGGEENPNQATHHSSSDATWRPTVPVMSVCASFIWLVVPSLLPLAKRSVMTK